MIAPLDIPNSPVDPETLLPDLLRAHPHARAIFDQYGLRGCGGALGPVESIRFFARTHSVDEAQLLAELEDAIERPEKQPTALEAPSVADTICRRFFTAGIVVILTAGASWGAWLLWRIGFSQSFTGVGINDVNAHGHAQIFGWVGLFMMGFAYQAFPRIWHTTLAAPRLAVLAFALMIAGLTVRTIGMPLSGHGSWPLVLAMVGAAMETGAIVLFVGQILATFLRSDARLEAYVGFALCALFYFVAMSGMSMWHTYNTMTASSRQSLLRYVGTYQTPLRDIQIHGLAMLMILGVCMRMLPPLFGVPAVPPRRAWAALGILNAAVIGEVALFIAYRMTMNHALAAMLLLAWLMLIIGAGMVALPWRLWRPMPEGDRSGKFVRAAYAWLAISLGMLLLFPMYQLLSGRSFSHAYYGSVRHAITVGFISLMIMGFAAKVVPTLNGVDTKKLSALWGPFLLVNAGCFLRVFLQTLTDWLPQSFSIVGISGMLEVAGLAWWGLGLIAIMRAGKKQALADGPTAPRPASIEPRHRVAEIIEWYPQTAPVFELFGFRMLKNPLLRRTLARGVTVSDAARMHGVDVDEFVSALNGAIGG